MSGRFRWTRARYRRADHLARLLSRMQHDLHAPPELVERYFRLWSRYRPEADPLAEPLWLRLSRFKGDDIPF